MEKFIFSFANTTSQVKQLNIPATQKSIMAGFEHVKYQKCCSYEWLPNVSVDKIANLFYGPDKEQIKTFQFSGHGAKDSFFFMKESNFTNRKIKAKSLIGFLAKQQVLKLLVLDCCNSLELAKAAVHAGIPVAIGTQTSLQDEASLLFNQYFWKEIISGETINDAFIKSVLLYKARNERRLHPPMWKLVCDPKNPDAIHHRFECINCKKEKDRETKETHAIVIEGKAKKSFISNEVKTNGGSINIRID